MKRGEAIQVDLGAREDMSAVQAPPVSELGLQQLITDWLAAGASRKLK